MMEAFTVHAEIIMENFEMAYKGIHTVVPVGRIGWRNSICSTGSGPLLFMYQHLYRGFIF